MLIKLASTRDRETTNVRKVAGHFSPNAIRILINTLLIYKEKYAEGDIFIYFDIYIYIYQGVAVKENSYV